MMSSCSISGVPRMIQTTKRLMSEMGLNPSSSLPQALHLLALFLAMSAVSTASSRPLTVSPFSRARVMASP